MPRCENPVEYPFAAEAAAALGHAGRQLKKALDALRRYDSHVSAGQEYGVPPEVWQAMGPRNQSAS